MTNLENSPWDAFSSLRTLGNYTDEQLDKFTERLLDSSYDFDEAYFSISAFIETLVEIKDFIESKDPYKPWA